MYKKIVAFVYITFRKVFSSIQYIRQLHMISKVSDSPASSLNNTFISAWDNSVHFIKLQDAALLLCKKTSPYLHVDVSIQRREQAICQSLSR